MSFKILLLSLAISIASCTQTIKPVKIKGAMSALKGKCKLKTGTAIESLTRNYIDVPMDENGYFDIEIRIEKPQCVTLGYVQFYAIPGAKIEIEEIKTAKGKRSSFNFKGDYAELNNFVNKHRLYTKSGSYCQGGMNVMNKRDIEDFIAFCRDKTEKWEKDLEKLGSEYDDFKPVLRHEHELNYYYSLICYPGYLKYYQKDTNVEKLFDRIKSELPKQISALNSNSSIDRSIYGSEKLKKCGVHIEECDEMEKLFEALNIKSIIESSGITKETEKRKNEFVNSCDNNDYKNVIEEIFAKFEKVKEGNPVIDFEFVDVEGKAHKLSDYKGKTIVVDLWATWCGPCMKEKPHFAEIAKKYAGKKDVVFLALSCDDEKGWNRYLKKHHDYENLIIGNTSRANVDKSFVVPSISRFLVIDKNFKISIPFALKPSSGELEGQIEKQ